MVAFASIGCLSGNIAGSPKSSPKKHHPQHTNDHLQILAFEAAKTVSRLLALYKSLSDAEILKLRKEIFKSKAVVFLNSDDEGLLLKLAYTEKIESLDKAAAAVARLGGKTNDLMLNRFDSIYDDLKSGKMDLKKFEYGSGKAKKKIRSLKKFLCATLDLYASLKTSHGLEVSEKKLNFPVLLKYMNFPAIDLIITPNRKHSRHSYNTNLWTQPFDKVVRVMSRVVCIVYARMCAVFGPYVPDLPTTYTGRQRHVNVNVNVSQRNPSEFWILEPKTDKATRPRLVRANSHIHKTSSNDPPDSTSEAKNNKVFHAAGRNTLGACRLQMLYANLIIMAQESMRGRKSKDEMRDEMYKMLPENLKGMVKMKMRKMKDGRGNYSGSKEKMKEALHKTFLWLAPMAHNTLMWQRETRVEMSSYETRPPVLLLQTLHFADKDKVEATIAEVLAGLSFIYMHQKRRAPAA